MNELTRNLTSVLTPRAALIAYSYAEYGKDKYHLELREIDGRGVMGEARPVTYEFMNELTHGYAAEHNGIPYGAIPPDMLYADSRYGHMRYIWYDKPRKHMMYFRQSLGIENAEYRMPGIIYEAVGTSLNVYAYKGSEPPTRETELYAAPFFNVTRERVCLGSAKAKKNMDLSYEELCNYWEQIFWLSEFSHLGGTGNPTKSNLVTVTKAARNAPFDENELKPLNIKLKNILK